MSGMADVMGLREALAQLDRMLPAAAGDLWESLRPPASASDLDELRRVVAPHDLPEELLDVLSWHDGQATGAPWWPVTETGPLLSAAAAMNDYQWLRANCPATQWHPSWLPIIHQQLWFSAIELAPEHRGLIIEVNVDGAFPRAASLAAVFHATVALLEAGTCDGYDAERHSEAEQIIASTYTLFGELPPQDIFEPWL